jgi:hypothetical protein
MLKLLDASHTEISRHEVPQAAVRLRRVAG